MPAMDFAKIAMVPTLQRGSRSEALRRLAIWTRERPACVPTLERGNDQNIAGRARSLSAQAAGAVGAGHARDVQLDDGSHASAWEPFERRSSVSPTGEISCFERARFLAALEMIARRARNTFVCQEKTYLPIRRANEACALPEWARRAAGRRANSAWGSGP